MSMHVLSCLKKIVTNITFDYVRRSDLWTLILCNSVLQTFFSPSVEVIKGALTWRLWRLVILPQDLNLYQLMKWGNICTIKSGATTNWTLPVFTQFHVKWNPSKSSIIKTISYKPALLKEEKNLVNWFLMRKENFKKADKRNALISVNDLFWSTFVQYSACVEK